MLVVMEVAGSKRVSIVAVAVVQLAVVAVDDDTDSWRWFDGKTTPWAWFERKQRDAAWQQQHAEFGECCYWHDL